MISKEEESKKKVCNKVLVDIEFNMSCFSDMAVDFTDIGNEVGRALGKYISERDGFTKDDFISGLEHGISLIDETH